MYKYKRKISVLLVIVVLLTTNLGIQLLPQSLKGGAEKYLSSYASAATAVSGITISQSTVALATGETIQLSATVSPTNATNKQVDWTVTSGSGIVTVSTSGAIETLKPGKAVVRATSADNNSKFKECTITVYDDDYGNTIASAAAIEDNSSIHGKIEVGGDADYFKFIAKAGAYEITTSSDPKGKSFDTYLHIYNSKGDEIAVNDSGTGLGYGYAGIKLNLTQNETYYIKFRMYNTTDVGDYILNVHPLAKPELTLSKSSASLVTGQKMQLEMTFLTPVASKQVIWSLTTGSGIVTVSSIGLVEALKPGKAVVRVSSEADSKLYKECSFSVSDDDYPNTTASAFAITSNSAIIHGKIDGYGDCDYFKFTPTQAGIYTISTSSDPEGKKLDTCLKIYDSTGKVTYNDNGEGQSSTGYSIIKMNMDENQTYYINLYLYYDNEIGGYILNIYPIIKPELTISQSTASIITGQEKQLSVNVITPDSNKQVLWSVASGSGIVSVSTSGLIKALSPGTAVVRVTSGTDSTVYKECTVTVSNDDFGNDIASAHEINLQSDSIYIHGKIEGEGDYDYFKFTAPKTGFYTISTSSDPVGSMLDTYLHLYASDGKEIATDDSSAGYSCAAIKNIKLNENNIYYIKMRMYYSNSVGNYILSFIPPVDIILSQNNVGLEVGKKLQLIADVKPEDVSQNVTWSVANGSEFVSVSSTGEIEALKAGTATVKATSVADSSVYKECTVTVSDVPLASIDIQNVEYSDKDILVKVTYNGCTLNGIINNKTGTPLVKDQDYTISDFTYAQDGITTDSAIITIRNSYLSTLPKNAVANLTFDFNNGLDPQLSVSVQRVDECFIATAAFGSKFQPAVAMLRQFRDKCLLTNSLGTQFVNFYYKNSPPIAKFISGNDILRGIVRGLLVPFIAIAYGMLHPVVGGLELLGIIFAIFIWRKRRTKSIKI